MNNFSLHMVFMCRFSLVDNCLKTNFSRHVVWTTRRGMISRYVENYLEFILLVEFYEIFNLLDAGGKPSTWFPPGRLVEHIYSIAPVQFNLLWNSLWTSFENFTWYFLILRNNFPPFCWRSKYETRRLVPEAIYMICCVSRAKIHFQDRKIDES